MKRHRNLFFAVILHSLLTKQQTGLVPLTRDSLQVRVGVLNSTMSYFTQILSTLR